MHASRLVELGARIALRGPRFAQSAHRISPSGVQQYWSASRQRFDHWAKTLDKYVPGTTATPINAATWTDLVRPLLEEVFTGELLVRIWTAVAIAQVRRDGESDLEPMLRGVLLNHLELRNRALNCLVFGVGPDSHQIVELQQVRRRVERWTDLLFGEMQRTIDVAEMANDPRRAKDYARTPRFTGDCDPASQEAADEELIESVRTSFEAATSAATFSPDHNRRLAASIVGCLQGDWIETADWNSDEWRQRLDNTSHDALMWLQDLFSLDEPRA